MLQLPTKVPRCGFTNKHYRLCSHHLVAGILIPPHKLKGKRGRLGNDRTRLTTQSAMRTNRVLQVNDCSDRLWSFTMLRGNPMVLHNLVGRDAGKRRIQCTERMSRMSPDFLAISPISRQELSYQLGIAHVKCMCLQRALLSSNHPPTSLPIPPTAEPLQHTHQRLDQSHRRRRRFLTSPLLPLPRPSSKPQETLRLHPRRITIFLHRHRNLNATRPQ